jgi:hypothetical protein
MSSKTRARTGALFALGVLLAVAGCQKHEAEPARAKPRGGSLTILPPSVRLVRKDDDAGFAPTIEHSRAAPGSARCATSSGRAASESPPAERVTSGSAASAESQEGRPGMNSNTSAR